MSFSLNTNIASLEAQNYLEASNNFQTQTINEVTSGLRIVHSGDDAAGLAIANGLQADQAVLTQGIQNANDGLATLQTIDGGINNITQLLDRAETLATQSASGTFTGDRTVLDQEFQSVLSEINRQATSIGLNTGGQFATDLSVYIGGGRGTTSDGAIQNGSVSVDLTNATVDTQSLGLSGYTAVGNTNTDIGTGGSNSVQSIVQNTANAATEANSGYTTFYFSGPGFSPNATGSNQIAVSVNLAGVTDTSTLATAINSAIQAAGNGDSQEATAFKNANIQASVYTNPTTNGSSIQFTSSTAAFQVSAGDQTANALLGNISTAAGATAGQGQSLQAVTTGSGTQVSTTGSANAETVTLNVAIGNKTPTAVTVSLPDTDASAADIVSTVNTALAAANSGAGAGVTASLDTNGDLIFTATGNANQGLGVQVSASGDTNNYLGLGTFTASTTNGGTTPPTVVAAAATAAGQAGQTLQIAVGNQVANIALQSTGTEATDIAALNAALAGNGLTRAAGIQAQDNGAGNIQLVSENATNFSVNEYDANGTGFGFGTATSVQSPAVVSGAAQTTINAQGTSESGALNFSPILTPGNSQTITLTAPDAQGQDHSISFSLSSANAGNINSALSYINTQLQDSNDSTLDQIVAVEQEQTNGTTGATSDAINFISGLNNFTVSLGTTTAGTASPEGVSNGTGANSQGGPVITSSTNGSSSTVDIGSINNAENALTALTNAVTLLGRAQAAVGKGENLFTYATNLAQSQVTNDAATESGIKDADLATEAANLSKAQILVQAGTAALAQANTAPQALLALLRQ